MPTRAEMDQPATVMCAVAGVVLLVVSGPFLFLGDLYCKSPSSSCNVAAPGTTLDFSVAWTDAAGAPVAISGLGNSGHANATATVEALMTSTVHVSFDPASCVDTFNPTLQQQAVSIQWKLVRVVAGDATQMGPGGTFTCAAGLNATVAALVHPDVARMQSNTTDGALADLWNRQDVAGRNETASYTLQLSWARPGRVEPPIPGTPVATSFSVQGTLRVDHWIASVTPVPKQVIEK